MTKGLQTGFLAVLAIGIVFSAPASAQTLFSDGQGAHVDFSEGPFARLAGSRGMGKVFYTFRARSNTFGPTRILSHDRDALVARGQTTTCAFTNTFAVICENGSRGTWVLARD